VQAHIPPPDAPKRVVVACLGDSITAGSPSWDPDPSVRAGIGAELDERSQWEWWAARASPRLEIWNFGVYGERTDEIAARLDRSVRGADALVVQGGINDVAQGRPVAEAAARLRAMVRRGRALGLLVALADLLPWNGGWPAAEAPIRELNALIRAIAEDEVILLLPFHATLEDPERPGRMRDHLTSDGDHPSVEGYRLLGELTAERLGEAALR
jgi:acyl-CoA thioesterase-1